MSESGKAVFLSYASQDAEAARRICEALRAAGVEVWFDQSELRGGDAWDAKIRRQIKECALFVPVISANTQSRHEGYFRLEWRLADQRTHLMGRTKAFLMPVCIDRTPDADADVPDSFSAVQWTRLPGGETPVAFSERVKKLLGGLDLEPGRPRPGMEQRGGVAAPPKKASRSWLVPAVVGAAAIGVLAVWQPWRQTGKAALVESKAAAVTTAAPLSEARQLAARARAILESSGAQTFEGLTAAEELCKKALALDSTDAEVWALAARVDAWMVFLSFDPSEERRRQAQVKAARAMALAPESFEARRAQAYVFGLVIASPEMVDEAVKTYRTLLKERPTAHPLLLELGLILRDAGRFDESAAVFEEAGDPISAGWNYFVAGRYDEAGKIADRLLAQQRTSGAVLLKVHVEWLGFEDLEAAQAAASLFTPAELQAEEPVTAAMIIALYRRDADRVIRLMTAFPHDFLSTRGFFAPKRYWIGVADELAGRPEAARAEWQVAAQQIEERLKTEPNSPPVLIAKSLVLACLGEKEEAERVYRLRQGLLGQDPDRPYRFNDDLVFMRLGRGEAVLSRLASLWKERQPGWDVLHANVRFTPEFDSLRGDPRFEQLLRENLPKFAKPFENPAAK